jgi:hypothetical protein
MPEWIKVFVGSVALMLGASGPSLFAEWHRGYGIHPIALDQPHNQSNLQKSQGEKGSANPAAPIVKEVSSQSTTNVENREEKKARQDRRLADYTELLFFATLFLGMATAGLVVVAYYQMRDARRSIDASIKAATAAAASAKAADRNIALAFRPRLVVRRISLDKWNIHEFGEIQFIVANVGVSPGKIVESNATIHVLRQGTLPAIPPYSDSFNSMGNPTVDPGPGIPEKAMTVMPVTDHEYDRVFGAPRGRLYLIGYIVYDGEAGRQHMAFGREYDNGTKRFGPVTDPNYEYGE